VNNFIAIGTTIFLYGVLTLLNYFRVTYLNQEEIFSIVFIMYGLVAFIKAFHKLKRGGLFFTSVIMSIGIILSILTNYEILNWYNVVTPSIFYVTATGLLTLYIENLSEKVFLIGSVFFFALAITIVLFVGKIAIVDYANKITLILFEYWPLFLILLGVLMIVRKPQIKSSSAFGSSVDASE